MSVFGPSFDSELQVAGLNGLPFWWSADGQYDITALNAGQQKTFKAVAAAHDPTKPAPAPVPQQVPMWAAQAALKQAGKYDAINGAIVGNATADPPVASMEATNAPVYFAWTMGNFASRQSAFIATLASQFGMKDTDIDAVFVAADKIAQTAG